MTQGPVIVGGTKAKMTAVRIDPGTGWLAAQVLGGTLVVAGAFDLALAFYPPAFGNPQWLFAVLSATIGGLAVLSLGLVGGLLASMARGSRKGIIWFTALNGLLALLLLIGIVTYVGVIGDARAALPADAGPEVARAITRTLFLSVVFLVLHCLAVVFGRKSLSDASIK
jgi:hypothetical protein